MFRFWKHYFIVLQGFMREGKCHLSLGDPSSAMRAYNRVLQLEPKNQAAKKEVCYQKIIQDSVEFVFSYLEI